MAEETQDFQKPLQYPLNPGPEEGSPRTRNRPAAGARQASPDEVFTQGFQGNATAGDFLGLDLEFIGATAENDLDLAEPPRSGEDSSGGTEAEDFGAEEAMDVLPVDEAGTEGELSDLPFEETPESFGDLDHEENPAARGGSRKKLLLGAGGLVAVGVAAYFFVPGLGSKDLAVPGESQVAELQSSKRPARPAGLETPEANPSAPAPKSPAQPVETYVASTNPAPSSAGPVDSTPLPEEGESLSLLSGLGELFGGAPDPGAVDPLADATSAIASVLGVSGSAPASAAYPDFSQGFEWVSEDMLDMIWRGTEIPMEAIVAPARTLMPRVGMVRLFMKSGEVFEGRVYAVGQNLVWLETEPGRIGLDGGSLERYEHLAVEASVGRDGLVPMGNLVRVRVPGGVLDGRILAQEGSTMTVVLDSGAKITVEDAAVEPLQTSRAKVVKR